MLVSSFCASRPRDATRRMSATELVLRSSVAAATPSQQHCNLALKWSSHRRRHLEEGRELCCRVASAPSQQHQLRRSSTQQQQATAVSSVPRR